METITKALIVVAVILLVVNVLVLSSPPSDLGYDSSVFGYRSAEINPDLSQSGLEGFSSLSHSYEGQEPIFVPEGYGDMGQFHGFSTMPIAYRQVNVGGVPREELRKMYPAPKNFDRITLM